MGFLIRCAFWFSLVLLVLPLDSGRDDGGDVGVLQALSAAREAVGDVAAICERKPDVCVTGRSAIETIGGRAREGVRIVSDLLGEQQPAQPDTETMTGSVPVD